jgi:phosphate/sulfate permease
LFLVAASGGIADPSYFTRQPEVYAYGMVCALGIGTLWLAFASYVGYNVSSTHTISKCISIIISIIMQDACLVLVHETHPTILLVWACGA